METTGHGHRFPEMQRVIRGGFLGGGLSRFHVGRQSVETGTQVGVLQLAVVKKVDFSRKTLVRLS